jgi:hypothetical protein
MQYISDPVVKLDLVQARLDVAARNAKQMQEYDLEVERATMVREDKHSKEVEEFNHRRKFRQKDKIPPPLPHYLTEDSQKHILKNKPVARTPMPGAPTSDNFLKYRISPNINLPMRVDFTQVKILWSKEKEAAEEEQKRLEELRQQKEREHKRLCNLVKFCKDHGK